MIDMAKLVLFNKPFQVLCQFSQPEGSDKKTLSAYLDIPDVYAAGRLDYDSEGLLLLTDNGPLQHQIAHPKNKESKTYWVQVEGIPDGEAIQALQAGVILKDGPTLPAKVKIISTPNIWERNPPIRERTNIPTSWLEIELKEGRNRQVRRMTAAVGHPTLRLIRARIGKWSLDQLQPGEFKLEEVESPVKPQSAQKEQSNPRRNSGKRFAHHGKSGKIARRSKR